MRANLSIFPQKEPRSAPAHEVLLQRHQRQRVYAGRVEHGVDRVEHGLRPQAPRGTLPAARPATGDYGSDYGSRLFLKRFFSSSRRF